MAGQRQLSREEILTTAGITCWATRMKSDCSPTAEAAWQPSKPVEFVIMAGPGGGADIYARLISGLIEKNKLAPVAFVPVNRDGGAGAVAMDIDMTPQIDAYRRSLDAMGSITKK